MITPAKATEPYKVWKEMREPKKESTRLKTWKRQHEELVDFFVEDFKKKNPDWVLVTEHAIEKQGISGRIDVLAGGENNQFMIWEIKTGKMYPYHEEQLRLYIAYERMQNPDANIAGYLKYIDSEFCLEEKFDANSLWRKAMNISDILEKEEPPDRRLCMSCRWYDYGNILKCPK